MDCRHRNQTMLNSIWSAVVVIDAHGPVPIHVADHDHDHHQDQGIATADAHVRLVAIR